MKHILTLFSAFFLFALCGTAQNPSKSALELLDGRNYKLLIEREVINRWEKSSDSFSIGLIDERAATSLVNKPKAEINSQEVLVSDHWIAVNGDKITARIGDILDYQLAGDADVNKKYGNTAADNGKIREFDITEYKEVAKKNKRNIDITAYHDSGVHFNFKISVTSKGIVLVRLYDKAGNQIREYKGVLDMNYGQ